MDYKNKLSNLYSILKDNFSDDITYRKEKDYLYLECKGIDTPKHKNLTLNLKIKYNDLMLNEMAWAYSAGAVADDHYVLRSDTLASIEKSLRDVINTEKFNSVYLDSLPKNEASKDEAIKEAKNQIYLKVINEIQSLGLGLWRVEFMNSFNDYLLVPATKGMLKEGFNLTVDVLNTYDMIKMLELKQALNNPQAYHEIQRVKDVLKRLL